MFGLPLRLTLLLWIGGAASTQGEVLSSATVSGEAGQALLLGCNVTTATGDSVHQVRWLDSRDKLLLAYQPRTPIHISHQERKVELAAWQKDASYISMANVQPEDEGCYRCVFDVFPAGSQEGVTCVSVTVRVHQDGNKTAVSGKPATLSCRYSLPGRVLQVLWKKMADQGGGITVASYSRGHYNVDETLQGRLSLSKSLGHTRLLFQTVTMDDEACYTCEFHTFPDGTRRGTACFSVYVLPEVKVTRTTSSSGVAAANCTARSRPAAELAWDVGGYNQSLNTSFVTLDSEGDGTTTVTSTLLLSPGQLAERPVRCIVRHRGLEEPLSVSPNDTTASPVTTVIIGLLCSLVAVLILVSLCVYHRGQSFKGTFHSRGCLTSSSPSFLFTPSSSGKCDGGF
ncbi:OX-2 membrane glycoprotein [Vanacampus margaritifer]